MGRSGSGFLSTEFEKYVDNFSAFLFLGDGCPFLSDQKGTNGPGHLLLPLRGNSPCVRGEKHFSAGECEFCPFHGRA